MNIVNPDAFLQLLLLVMASDLNFYPSCHSIMFKNDFVVGGRCH